MFLSHEMISEVFQGTTFIVITLNQGSILKWLTRGHSQYHPNFAMLSGGRTRHWMYCWKVVLTIIGTWIVAGNYQAVDLFHPVHKIECKTSKWLHVVQRAVNHKFKQHPGPIIHGQKFGLACRKQLNDKKNRIGPLKSRSSTLLES